MLFVGLLKSVENTVFRIGVLKDSHGYLQAKNNLQSSHGGAMYQVTFWYYMRVCLETTGLLMKVKLFQHGQAFT